MSLDLTTPMKRLVSMMLRTGLFQPVNGHEPRNAPGKGLSMALFVQSIGPARGQSGQNSTSGLVMLTGRIFGDMITKPEDEFEIAISLAAAKVIEVLSGDFELGGNVRCVDLLGITGTPLSARAGYFTIGDNKFRIMDVAIPLIIDDIWDQEG